MHFVTYAGRLGRDASVKTLESGKTVMELALAVDIGWGEKKTTDWIKGEGWGERWAKLAPLLTKGRQVTICGRITVRAYLSKDGEAKVEIKVDLMDVTLQGGGEPRSDSAPPARAKPPVKPSSPGPNLADRDFNDDIPF